MRRVFVVASVSLATIAAASGALTTPASAGDGAAGEHAFAVGTATAAPLATPARSTGALPRSVQGLLASPGLADAKAASGASSSAVVRGPSHQLRAAPNLPVKLQQFTGMSDPTQSPGDATGAAGPNTIVQV